MTSLNDDLALRAALDDLATGQPDAPVERLASIRGKHVRRRRAQGIAAGVVTAAVVVGTLFGAGAIGHSTAVEPAQNRHLPSWALPWPDHRDPTTSDVLRAQAVAAWRVHSNGDATDPFYAPRQVIWYLTAPVRNSADLAVVFEVETDSGDKRLVAGYLSDPAHASQAENWQLYDAPAPAPLGKRIGPEKVAPPIVSFYIPQSGPHGDNLVVVLTTPVAYQVYVGDFGGMHRLDNGFALALATRVRDRVQLAVEKANGIVLSGGDVGLDGVAESQVPQLEQVPDFADDSSANFIMGSAGQGSTQDVDETLQTAGPVTVEAQCYGGARSIVVWVDVDRVGQRATVACDNQRHVVTGLRMLASQVVTMEVPGSPKGHTFGVDADQRVAFRISVFSGTRR